MAVTACWAGIELILFCHCIHSTIRSSEVPSRHRFVVFDVEFHILFGVSVGEGFEPPVDLIAYGALAKLCLKPLSHPTLKLYISVNFVFKQSFLKIY
jgi:hypothetical protein